LQCLLEERPGSLRVVDRVLVSSDKEEDCRSGGTGAIVRLHVDGPAGGFAYLLHENSFTVWSGAGRMRPERESGFRTFMRYRLRLVAFSRRLIVHGLFRRWEFDIGDVVAVTTWVGLASLRSGVSVVLKEGKSVGVLAAANPSVIDEWTDIAPSRWFGVEDDIQWTHRLGKMLAGVLRVPWRPNP